MLFNVHYFIYMCFRQADIEEFLLSYLDTVSFIAGISRKGTKVEVKQNIVVDIKIPSGLSL